MADVQIEKPKILIIGNNWKAQKLSNGGSNL